jgi:hypothetical protein
MIFKGFGFVNVGLIQLGKSICEREKKAYN